MAEAEGKNWENEACNFLKVVETRIPVEGQKEAYVCVDFAEKFWKKLDGSVDIEKPTDRWDWCGLNLGKSKDESEFISNPGNKFKHIDDFLNADGIAPPTLK